MAFLVGGANTLDSSYEISNSVRIGSGRKLSRTFTAVTAERKKHTISCWIKLCILDGENHMLYAAGSDSAYIRINDDHMFRFRFYASSDDQAMFQTNKLFRDVGAWYHIVFVYDSAQGTDTNRTKLYVNGVQETSFSSGTYSGGRFPDQNEESMIGSNAVHSIEGYSSGGEFYVADWYYIGNQALSPSDFGETNDNGVWVPKKYEGSFGSANDTFLEFKQTGTSTDASGIGADTSGEGNHMASTNLAATDVTTDTPTNNFATLNSLHKSTSNVVLSEGNLKAVLNQTSGWQHAAGTIAVKNGKWYWEAKALNVAATDKTSIGVLQFDTSDVDFIGNTNTDRSAKGLSGHGAGTGSYTYAQGDIVMCGMDLDNNKVYWGKNGTWFGTLDPAAGSGSTTQTISNANFCVPVVGGYADSSWEMNFGVPQFSISSGNADANGYGNFEYAVPSGYYALCTKNLAEYG